MNLSLRIFDVKRKLSIVANLAVILTLSYSISFGQSGNNVIIDDFSDDQPIVFVTLDGTNPDGSTIAAANTVGGERDLSVEVTEGSNANAEVLGGTFNLSVGAQSTGSATIVYDGADGDPFAIDFTGLSNLDLTNGGTEDRYKISVISADHPGSFTIEVYTDGENSSSVTKEFTENMDPTSFEIFFDEFTTANGGGADFTNVGAIVISATGEPEIDLIIDRICTEGPPPSCGLTSIVAGDPSCIEDNFTDYTVTVSWTGADESVTISAGGSGTPASVTTSEENGSVTFTYPQTETTYNITYVDSEELCSGLGTGLSGDAPTCTPPPMCEIFDLSGETSCLGETEYTVTVTWTGADESVTLVASGSGSPSSASTSTESGSVVFTFPIEEDYNISVTDTEELCTGNISGTNPSCFKGVPTMGEWALISLCLVFLIFGTMAMRTYVFAPSVTK